MSDVENNPSVLFFGRENCNGTEAILHRFEQCGFRVTTVLSGKRGETLPDGIDRWRGDYILSFRSLFILPAYLLEQAEIAAINFHPAPPEYPGSGCINFALYDDCDSYGVTAHLMNEKIDNGKILECRRFPVRSSDNLASILERTHSELEGLCIDFVTQISQRGSAFIEERLETNKDIEWRGEARRMAELEALQLIDPEVSAEELERIIRATYLEGFPPKIKLHGYEFALVSDKK